MSNDINKININAINIDNKEENLIKIYFISCFHTIIWENKLLDIFSSNKSVISIIIKNEEIYKKNKNYLIKLHQIIIKNNYNDIEKIALNLKNKSNNFCLNLGEIIFKSEEENFFLMICK